jgi:hypothetical protein
MAANLRPESKDFFHHTEKAQDGEILSSVVYDKSCQNNQCASTLFENYKYVFQRFSTEVSSGLFLVRDNSLLNLVQEKNNRLIKEKLLEFAEIIKHASKKQNMLLLVTGVRPYNLVMPNNQSDWSEYFNNFKGVQFTENALLTSVWALGPSAENFCGIMDESEILFRLNFVPPARKINLELFKNLFK